MVMDPTQNMETVRDAFVRLHENAPGLQISCYAFNVALLGADNQCRTVREQLPARVVDGWEEIELKRMSYET